MSEKQPWGTKAPAKVGRGFTTAILGFLSLGAIAALYVMGLAACKPGPDAGVASLAHETMAKLKPPAVAATYPNAGFVDGAGKPVKLSDFKGQAVVLNLWATWCAPCVKEMPTLAALQTAYAGKGLKVVALSADSASATDKAKAFIAAHPPLTFYQDASSAVPTSLNPPIEGFPTTLLYDAQGNLKGVMEGDTDWNSPDAKAVVDKLLKS